MLRNIINWFNNVGNNSTREEFNLEKLTALHESAHVICTYLSDYHSLIGKVCLNSNSTGETFVSLSKSKMLDKGKVPDSLYQDAEMAIDAAIIFYAGFEAEKIYCKKTNYKTDISHSLNDYEQVDILFNQANYEIAISKKDIKDLCSKIVLRQWNAIEDISNKLIQMKCVEAYDILEILNYSFKK